MAVPVAHAGHWLANALYVVPVLVIVLALLRQSFKDRRAERAAREEHDETSGGSDTPEP
jgi:hypothetical protein